MASEPADGDVIDLAAENCTNLENENLLRQQVLNEHIAHRVASYHDFVASIAIEPAGWETTGLMEKLQKCTLKNGTVQLCRTPVSHFSQRGSVEAGRRWACGYKNCQVRSQLMSTHLQSKYFQMICSSLMNYPTYRAALFDGTGIIPDVPGIQVRGRALAGCAADGDTGSYRSSMVSRF